MIDKKTITDEDGNIDVSKLPTGAMIDGDGNYVTVKADNATWNKFQEKVNKSTAAQEEEIRGSKELQDRGLECPIDKRLFVEPVKTPCCQTTYCNECITNALLDDDLRCPNCGDEGVLIDNLKPDTTTKAKIRSYLDEKATTKKTPEDASLDVNGADQGTPQHSRSTSLEIKDEKAVSVKAPSSTNSPPASPVEGGTKKRKADAELDNNRASPMPAAVSGAVNEYDELVPRKEPPRGPKAMMAQSFGVNPQNPMMNMNNAFPMNMPMPGMNGLMPMMFDPMTMLNQMNAMNQFMGMNGMNGGMPLPMGMMGGTNGMQQNQNYQQQQQGMGRGNVPQYKHFNDVRPNQEESAYFRAPVNPHRTNRRNAATRPADYREI